mmetsp:Transcript_7501/g.12837  ORF Transcript_7501/g.12837 Transcript_7501/m.12837 type:complete len:224 (-) Transcript_7501:111-782(-)
MVEPGTNVKYCGAGRLDDRIILASYVYGRADITRSNNGVKGLLSKGQISSSKTGTVPFEDGNLHYISDQTCAFFVSCAVNYPARTAFQFLQQLKTQFSQACGPSIQTAQEGTLTKNARQLMKDLCTKFDDVRNVDKIASVSDQVNKVKEVMSDNIQIMLQNQDQLEHLNESTEMLERESKAFQKKATTVKRTMWCKNLKMTLIIAAIIIIILVIIIASVIPKR